MEIYDEFGGSHLMTRHKTAFLCSSVVPPEFHSRILKWADERTVEDCIVTGRVTSLEKQVVDHLVEKGVPLILMALDIEEVKALIQEYRPLVMDGRMLVLALFGPGATLSKAQQNYMRNMAVLELADDVVVGYCNPEGVLQRQLSGCSRYVSLVKDNEHRYMDFLHLNDGFICLEAISKDGHPYCQISQRRKSGTAIRIDALQVDSDAVIRLRDMLDRAIEANHWGESRYTEVREAFPNAYRRWSPDEELILMECAQQGMKDEEIAQLLGRQPSAVNARLQKLIQADAERQQG